MSCGVDLRIPDFSHSQLHAALSLVRRAAKILQVLPDDQRRLS